MNNISYWLDEAEIRWGDDLLEKINVGIQKSKYVIIFLGTKFPEKPCAKKELKMAMSREIQENKTVVLPLILDGKILEIDDFKYLQTKKYLKYIDCFDKVISDLKKLL